MKAPSEKGKILMSKKDTLLDLGESWMMGKSRIGRLLASFSGASLAGLKQRPWNGVPQGFLPDQEVNQRRATMVGHPP